VGQAGGAQAVRECGRVGGGWLTAAPGCAPSRALGSRFETGGLWGGGCAAPERAPESRWGGDKGTPRNTRKRIEKQHLPCNAIDQSSVT